MRIPKTLKVFCIGFMSFVMTNVPSVTMAETMIPTGVVIEEMGRAQAEQRVRTYLNLQDVQKALEKQGYSADDVSARVASLSVSELNQLANQMDEARYGGDILFTVLIVVLIIFLVKRI